MAKLLSSSPFTDIRILSLHVSKIHQRWLADYAYNIENTGEIAHHNSVKWPSYNEHKNTCPYSFPHLPPQIFRSCSSTYAKPSFNSCELNGGCSFWYECWYSCFLVGAVPPYVVPAPPGGQNIAHTSRNHKYTEDAKTTHWDHCRLYRFGYCISYTSLSCRNDVFQASHGHWTSWCSARIVLGCCWARHRGYELWCVKDIVTTWQGRVRDAISEPI